MDEEGRGEGLGERSKIWETAEGTGRVRCESRKNRIAGGREGIVGKDGKVVGGRHVFRDLRKTGVAP